MPRQKGTVKTGGRKKGTPNKRTKVLSEALLNNGIDIPQKLAEIFPNLSYDKQADVLLSLMSFVYPKRKSIEIAEESIEPKNEKFEIVFVSPKNR